MSGENEDEKRIKDTNVENIGSAEDKAVRKAAAAHEPAWEGVGQTPGVKVWRIEQFTVHAIPEDEYGSFSEGDSYIVLNTKKEPDSDKLLHDIHFFIGKDSTPDEYGSAAYKTVELDDLLDQEPIQHREHQVEDGGPSDAFKALFPNGITYKEGGVVSGFRHVEKKAYDAKLWQIRYAKEHKTGEKKLQRIRCPLKTKNLIPGDSFVLDCTNAIYVLDGPQAAAMEKREANLMAEHIENERDGKVQATHDIDDDFWACLEGDKPSWFVSSPKKGSGSSAELPPAAGYGGGGGAPAIYPLAVLKEAKHPDDVHPDEKEKHLSDADFQEAFGMSKSDFEKQPKWKQQAAKKDAGLF
jgi:gelsolin